MPAQARRNPVDDPAAAVFQTELDRAIDAMLDGLLAKGYRIDGFAFAFNATLPDHSRVWGARSTGYTGTDGAAALAHAALSLLEKDIRGNHPASRQDATDDGAASQ